MAKRRRLGEVLQQRGHVWADDLNQALQEQRGKVIHLGELLLQRGTVSKPDLISALGEVTTLAYIDCTAVQVSPEVLKTIPAEMAGRHDVLPVNVHNGKLTVAMAEPQNLRLIDELRFKTGKEIAPRLGFHGEIREAVARHYGQAESAPPQAMRGEHAANDIEGMEFISSSEQQWNIEAMREIQAELLQKSKTTPRGAGSRFDNQSGGSAVGKRYPHRAAIGRDRYPPARRRHSSRLPKDSESATEFRGLSRENSLGHGYFRAASPAGRPLPGEDSRAAD